MTTRTSVSNRRGKESALGDGFPVSGDGWGDLGWARERGRRDVEGVVDRLGGEEVPIAVSFVLCDADYAELRELADDLRDRDERVGDADRGGSVARDVAENLRCWEIDQRSSSHSPMEHHLCFRCNLRTFDADQGGRHLSYIKQYK